MAEVYRARVDPRVGLQLPSARPVISPLSVVGQALAETGDRVGRSIGRVQDQLEHDEHAWLSSTLAQARADWGVTLAERKAAAEPGAPEFSPALLKDFDDWSSKTVERAKGRAQGELAARLKVIRADLAGDALAFETGARTEWAKSQITGALENGRTAVFSAPQHFETALGEQLGILAKSKLPGPVKAGLERKIREGLTEAYVAAQIERDPSSMLAALGPGRTDSVIANLSFEDRRKLRSHAESQVRQRDSDARSATALRLQMEDRAERRAEKEERKQERAAETARKDREASLTLGILTGDASPRDVLDVGMVGALDAGQIRTLFALAELPEKERERLRAKAESEVKQRASDARAEMSIKLQMEERAARLADKAEKKMREERELGLTVGLLAGQTTPAEIMQAGKLRQLGADQVRTLMSLSRQEGEGSDDWRIAADLRIRANSGEDVMRDALQARQAGAISNRTLSTITDEVQQQRTSGGAFAREDVKSARKQLEEILLDGQNMFMGIKAPTAEKVARADDMFRRRMMDDPTADPVKVRDQVLQTFKGGAMDEAALPKSRFLVGTVRQPDIAASTSRLQEALAAGRITQAEFLNEFEAIKEISKYSASLPVKPSAPAAQPAAPAAGGSWFNGLLGQ